ncbi:pilus assembly protein Flp/PilA [Cohaesibacter sp. ES.047]|uniref:Flp family type IVb pilin n=1 Tax=Cohaesibacter sp. ES.047 TaxID=1798205 RepID=UPI000BB92C30|nr:Flp family type IVb pilin [Cohaesibacter sp. ES.047]SNY91820.1 pilus assembly protein Flp/PilA [Cohaesibacter sp. ES.047]
MKNFARFIEDESGATAIEYALLAGLIGIGIVTAAGTLRDEIVLLMGRISTALQGAVVS